MVSGVGHLQVNKGGVLWGTKCVWQDASALFTSLGDRSTLPLYEIFFEFKLSETENIWVFAVGTFLTDDRFPWRFLHQFRMSLK